MGSPLVKYPGVFLRLSLVSGGIQLFHFLKTFPSSVANKHDRDDPLVRRLSALLTQWVPLADVHSFRETTAR